MNDPVTPPGFEPFSPEEKRRTMERHANAAGFFKLLGLRLVDLEPGHAVLEMPFREEITHSGGVVQGGILTTLADTCIAHATLAALNDETRFFTTVELKINFIRPANQGTFTAQAQIIHLGRRTAVGEAEIRNQDGKLVAKCLSSLIISDRP